jgi:hypothetical protein
MDIPKIDILASLENYVLSPDQHGLGLHLKCMTGLLGTSGFVAYLCETIDRTSRDGRALERHIGNFVQEVSKAHYARRREAIADHADETIQTQDVVGGIAANPFIFAMILDAYLTLADRNFIVNFDASLHAMMTQEGHAKLRTLHGEVLKLSYGQMVHAFPVPIDYTK